jgi:hypothetical protein
MDVSGRYRKKSGCSLVARSIWVIKKNPRDDRDPRRRELLDKQKGNTEDEAVKKLFHRLIINDHRAIVAK